MRPLEIDSSISLGHILNELKTTEEDGLELTSVPGEKTILDNPVNRAVIEKVASEYKKEVVLPAVAIEESPIVESDDLGFVEGEDVVSKMPMQEVPKMIKPAASTPAPVAVKPGKKFSFPKFAKNKLVLGGAALLVLLILLGVGFVFFPTAQVTLTLEAQDEEMEATIVGDPKATEVSTEDNIIPIEVQEVTKEGSDEAQTTGKKTIGTAAKGRVTIVNQDTNSGKNFLAGTTITPVATHSATFKLDSSVSLSKAPIGSNDSAGVNVTATQLGPGGNLPAGVYFKVGSSNETLVYAKNDLAFSGGTTKQAQVVTSGDRESLKEKIVDKLTSEAEDELSEKVGGGLVPDEGLTTKVVSESYEPKAVDAEASKVKATINIKSTASVVKKEDLNTILVALVEKDAKDEFEVDQEASEITAQVTDKPSDGTVKMTATIKAKLIPKLNKDEIRNRVAGQSLGNVRSYLESLENVSGYEVKTSPWFFRFLGFMPFLKDKITINFATQ